MVTHGQRFKIDLDSEEESSHVLPSPSTQASDLNVGLLRDIKERVSASTGNPPSPPRMKGSETGFPAHKIRTETSRFKRKREAPSPDTGLLSQNLASSSSGNVPLGDGHMTGTELGNNDKIIDRENKQRLAQMSEEEIEEARQELMSGLSPSLIEKLLKKANIDDDQEESDSQMFEETLRASQAPVKKVTFGDMDSSRPKTKEKHNPPGNFSPDDAPLQPPTDLRPATSHEPLPPVPDIHFPQPPKPPALDPSDPGFLSALHSNYFPSLPADPSTLAWMTPVDPTTEAASAYSPSQQSLTPSALRFDFRGHLLPPRLSSQISITKGLHHHGHAPSSAGYTVPELSHLARSTYPSQRCIAYQTLGRILYRLGRGDFGLEGDDLCEGLWQLMDEGKVLENLVMAAGRGEGGNRTVWVTATDAVWLWRKGGGRKWQGR
ncbi:hypothetical protein N7G274_002065 [Stereocaulon virgatum]|uniref:Transcription factor Rba50 n=1 Tax=Stereocaulon virgatum TaxID=373712 RepID=A0ABR4AIN4_9LECA